MSSLLVILRWRVYHSIVPIWRGHRSSTNSLRSSNGKSANLSSLLCTYFLFLVSACSILLWYIHVHYIHVGFSITLLSFLTTVDIFLTGVIIMSCQRCVFTSLLLEEIFHHWLRVLQCCQFKFCFLMNRWQTRTFEIMGKSRQLQLYVCGNLSFCMV